MPIAAGAAGSWLTRFHNRPSPWFQFSPDYETTAIQASCAVARARARNGVAGLPRLVAQGGSALVFSTVSAEQPAEDLRGSVA